MVADDFVLSWSDFCAALKFGNEFGIPQWVQGDGLLALGTLSIIRHQIHSGRAIPLLQLLTASSGRSATDPRDKIYALLGISRGFGSDIQPDYTVNVEELYMDLAARQIHIYGAPNFLSVLNVPAVLPEIS